MDNKIEIFKNEQFCEVRTILEGEKVLFCAADVAKQAAGQVGVTVRMHTENGFLVSACTERIAAKLTDALQSLGVTVYSQIPVLKDHSKFSE